LVAVCLALPAFGQDGVSGASASPSDDTGDMQHGVARISVIEGQVSVKRGDADWVAGVINAPLIAGDKISSGPNSRAEVEFDAANLIRLGGTADIRVSELAGNQLQVELSRGTVTYRVIRTSSLAAEVDTPNVSVRPARVGVYRVAVTESGQTELTVRSGDVEVFSPRGSQWVNAGQTMIARGTTSDPEFQIVAAPAADGWDAWNEARDRVLLQSRSAQRVPQGVYGSEDLDAHGNWVYTPDYGNVWQPTVPPDWAPYQMGEWIWLDGYGWTWVSTDCWGWAPYHYGRWFWRGGYGWLWYPGVWGRPHYWSPALVGFFGFGGGAGFGVQFGFGNIGWVPLAPYEVLHPWWGRGYYRPGGYINRSININGVNIRNAYQNARVTNGVSGLSVRDFQSGRMVGGAMVRPNAAQFASAGMIRGAVPLSARGAAASFSTRGASYVPRTSGNTSFYRAPQSGLAQRGVSGGFSNSGNAPSSGWNRFGSSGAGRPGGGSVAPSSSGFHGSYSSGGGAPTYGGYAPRPGSGGSAPARSGGSGGKSSAPRASGGGHSSGGAPRSGGGSPSRR
jgi:hypothetical protein